MIAKVGFEPVTTGPRLALGGGGVCADCAEKSNWELRAIQNSRPNSCATVYQSSG